MSNTNKKPTINEEFAEIIAVIKGEKTLTEAEVAEKVAFLNKRIEVNTKKNSSSGSKKLTATQIENIGLSKAIYEYLTETGKAMTLTQMKKEIAVCADLEIPRINGVVMYLYDCEKRPNTNPMLIRFTDKGSAYFKANPDYIAEVEGE